MVPRTEKRPGILREIYKIKYLLVVFLVAVCYDKGTSKLRVDRPGGKGVAMLPSTIWLIALVVLVIGEGITVGLTFIWFAVGALGGLITAVLGGPIWLQIVVFLVLSGLSLALIRPFAARFLRTSRTATNADRVIGKTAVVTEDIDNVEGKGQVNVSCQIWSARSEHSVVIPSGTEVRVLRIEGVKLFVEAL